MEISIAQHAAKINVHIANFTLDRIYGDRTEGFTTTLLLAGAIGQAAIRQDVGHSGGSGGMGGYFYDMGKAFPITRGNIGVVHLAYGVKFSGAG